MRHSSRFCPSGKSTVEGARETARTLAQEGQTRVVPLAERDNVGDRGGEDRGAFLFVVVWFGVED